MAPTALLLMGITIGATYFVQAVQDAPLTDSDGTPTGKQRLRNIDTIVQQHFVTRGMEQRRRLLPNMPPMYKPGMSSPTGDRLFDVTPMEQPDTRLDLWGPWSDWSLCSRSCGGGVARRYRHCVRRLPATCKGPALEYILCNTLDCPTRSPSFREVQCLEHGSRFPRYSKYEWVPYLPDDGARDCQLNCTATELHIIQHFGTAIDGTRCSKDEKRLCIAGECVKIGCDMIVGSTMTEDACGVCGGNNGTCFHHQEVFNHLPDNAEFFNYNEVARIPIGATHVFVREDSPNYLALMEADDHFEQYVVNGNRVVSWPGEFETAGTSVAYNRVNHSETFHILGPTKKDLYIMILYLGQEPRIQFDYWIPNARRPGQFPFYLTDYYSNYDVLDYPPVIPPVMPAPSVPTTTSATSTTTVTTTTSTTTLPATTTTTTPEQTTISVKTSTIVRKIPEEKAQLKGKAFAPLGLKRSKRCGKCKRPKNRKVHYCLSEFAVHARIISKKRFRHGRDIRYDVEVVTTYKSDLKLMEREYVWVPSVCCPKLRPLRTYLLMGRKVKVDITNERRGKGKSDHPVQRRYETRLIVSDADYWATWKKSNERTMAKVANKLNCGKLMARKAAQRNNATFSNPRSTF